MPASGTYPALKVEFAPGVAASSVPGDGDWVNISADTKRLNIKWGREDEFSQPGAGTLSLELDNSDGKFDPDNLSGPYYGSLKPLTWVRVTGGTGVDYTRFGLARSYIASLEDVFYGQVSIEGWRLSASQFSGAVDVTIDVLDGLEQLANTDVPASVWVLESSTRTPRAWYRMGESSGTEATDSSGNGRHGISEGGLTFNSRSGLVEGDSNGALEFDGVDDIVSIPPSVLPSAVPYSVSLWLSVGAQYSAVFAFNNPFSSSPYVGLRIGGVSNIMFDHYQGAPTHTVTSNAAIFDNQPHHVVVVVGAVAANSKIYVDGIDATASASGSAPTLFPSVNGQVGSLPMFTDEFAGVLDELTFYGTALSAADVSALYAAGTAPWANELTSARVTHVLDAIAWPASLRSIETGQSTMPQADLAGADALSTLQAIALAEGGRVFIDHQDGGKLRFEDRHERLTLARSTTSQATFGDGGGTEVPYDAIDLQDDRIINAASLARFGGSTITVEDATSQTTYQERDYSETGLLTTSDSEVASRAATIVAEKKDRHRRVRSMTLRPRGTGHLGWAQVFARRVGDRITVKWRPPYGGTYTYYAWIEAIAHDWVQADAAWTTTFWLSPVPYDSSGHPYWILGTSTLQTGTSTTRLSY